MNLRSLLPKSTQRQLKIIEMLYNAENTLTNEEISTFCSSPGKTIQSDIATINKEYPEFRIESKNNRYTIQRNNEYGLDYLYYKILKSSTILQLLELLLFEDHQTISELAEHLYTSNASISRMIRKIEGALKPLGIKVIKRPMRLIGEESTIRHLFMLFFREKKTSFSSLAKSEDTVIAVRMLIDDFMQLNSFSEFEAYITYLRLEYCFYISLIRISNGHFFANKVVQSPAVVTPDLAHCQAAILNIEKSFPVLFDQRMLRDCLWLYYGDFIMTNQNQREIALKNNTALAKITSIADEYIDYLEESLQFSFDEDHSRFGNLKDTMSTYLCNESYFYRNVGDFISIIGEYRKMFIEAYARKYSYQTEKLKKAVLDFTKNKKLFLTEDMTYNHLYVLIVQYPQILVKISSKSDKINILVLSLVYPLHETFIVDGLSEGLHGAIEYHHVTKPSELENNPALANTIDLVISTSSEGYRYYSENIFQGIPVFVVEPFISSNTFNELQAKINEIAIEKALNKST